MTEQIHHLLAHRGREGEEEGWECITLSRTALEAEAPPSPPLNAKVRKVDRGPLYWVQTKDDDEDAAQATWSSEKKAQYAEERRRATEEFDQRKIDLDKRPLPPSSSRCVTPLGESRRESVAG